MIITIINKISYFVMKPILIKKYVKLKKAKKNFRLFVISFQLESSATSLRLYIQTLSLKIYLE